MLSPLQKCEKKMWFHPPNDTSLFLAPQSLLSTNDDPRLKGLDLPALCYSMSLCMTQLEPQTERGIITAQSQEEGEGDLGGISILGNGAACFPCRPSSTSDG